MQLKDALITALRSLPPDFVVGFVVFGSSVRVYRLNHEKEVMHADVIGGRASPTKDQLGILNKQVNFTACCDCLCCRIWSIGAHCFCFSCNDCIAFSHRFAKWKQ
jgi:hypothetical protein